MPTGKDGTKFATIEPLAKLTEHKMRDFIWKSSIYRIGIPNSIVTDNGKRFDNAQLKTVCEELNVRKHFLPRSLQPNG